MSIYATLWTLKFPRYGDDHPGCEWVVVIGQGVPAHVGAPSSGAAPEGADPYAGFLPAADGGGGNEEEPLRAVVFVTEGMPKGTARSAQEYAAPLLVMAGREYATLTFAALHARICDALRGHRPRLVAESSGPDRRVRMFFEDGSVRDADGADA
jgi:hypothetical protein